MVALLVIHTVNARKRSAVVKVCNVFCYTLYLFVIIFVTIQSIIMCNNFCYL